MADKIFELRRGNVVVKVYTTHAVKNGQSYTSYAVSDYTSGSRRLHTFADLEKAKQKAQEIATAIAKGEPEVLHWQDDLRVELRMAMETLQPTGVTVLPASQFFAQAVKILGNSDELLAAC